MRFSSAHPLVPNPGPMKNDQILSQISEYCRQADMAETTFGRRAVNDGKLVHRLREGKRITIDTLDRIQAYIAASMPGGVPPPRGLEVAPEKRDPRGNFRFFENRQKYLLFVHTCSEKRVIAERVALELSSIHPRPPALRVFDAGVGDGTVLARVMRSMHGHFPHMPFYIAGKELSLEDVRLTLDKVPDRLFEHPATVFVLTNMYYAEAPWLTPASPAAAAGMIWHEVALRGPPRVNSRPRSPNWGRFWSRTGGPMSARARACRSMSGRSRSCCTGKTTGFCSTRSFRGPAVPRPIST